MRVPLLHSQGLKSHQTKHPIQMLTIGASSSQIPSIFGRQWPTYHSAMQDGEDGDQGKRETYDNEDKFIDDSEIVELYSGDRHRPKIDGFFINRVSPFQQFPSLLQVSNVVTISLQGCGRPVDNCCHEHP